MKEQQEKKIVQMIHFVMGGDDYAVDIRNVREVINMCEITELPKTPEYVEGIINLRGEVIPIIDLRKKFGLLREQYTALTNIIVVEVAAKAIGVVVDSVSHVIRVEETAITAAPPMIGGLSGKYVSGVARLAERLIVVLDMEKVLTAREIIELEKLDFGDSEAVGTEQEVEDVVEK